MHNNIPIQPIKLVSFEGNLDKNKVYLKWSVAENEIVDRFEVERSIDGKNFTMAALVFGTDKIDIETYLFKESKNADKMMYRLKMLDKNNKAEYSKTINISN
ncbi:MAG: hypothetical protein M3O67_05400 [Bacteroidota bacterium]|nr:hypothetical protein [Bacteroidota bacterium]